MVTMKRAIHGSARWAWLVMLGLVLTGLLFWMTRSPSPARESGLNGVQSGSEDQTPPNSVLDPIAKDSEKEVRSAPQATSQRAPGESTKSDEAQDSTPLASGLVVSGQGQPLAGAAVTLIKGAGSGGNSVASDQNGRFPMEPGQMITSCSLEGYNMIGWSDAQAPEHPRGLIVMAPMGRIALRVASPGRGAVPLLELTVVIGRDAAKQDAPSKGSLSIEGFITTEWPNPAGTFVFLDALELAEPETNFPARWMTPSASGLFRFDDLPAGTYRVTGFLQRMNRTTAESVQAGATAVELRLTRERPTTIELTLEAGEREVGSWTVFVWNLDTTGPSSGFVSGTLLSPDL